MALDWRLENYAKIHNILSSSKLFPQPEHEFVIATIETSPGCPATRRYMIVERHSDKSLTAKRIKELAEADEREAVQLKDIDEEKVSGKAPISPNLQHPLHHLPVRFVFSPSSPWSKSKEAHDEIKILYEAGGRRYLRQSRAGQFSAR